MYLPREASSAALPKSMVQEEQTIRRRDGPKPVVGASGDWSREEAVEVGGKAEEGGPSRRKKWKRRGGEEKDGSGMEGGERNRNRKGGEKRGMAARAGSAEELDEDAGREEGLSTPGGDWDEGEQGPRGRGELEEKNGVGERA